MCTVQRCAAASGVREAPGRTDCESPGGGHDACGSVGARRETDDLGARKIDPGRVHERGCCTCLLSSTIVISETSVLATLPLLSCEPLKALLLAGRLWPMQTSRRWTPS